MFYAIVNLMRSKTKTKTGAYELPSTRRKEVFMNGLINTKIGINRGVSRIWVEGHRLKPLFNIGDKLDLIFDETKKRAMLVVSENGIFTVSKRTRNGSVYPLIEIKTD